MHKYLIQILKEINTIIIPGLGALTITDKETRAMMFMSYLKHDDGILSAHIAKAEGKEETEAKNIIAKYVREITTSLDKGESFDMFKFGTFYKKDDAIEFKNWGADKAKPAKKTEEKKETTKDTDKKIVAKAAIFEEKKSAKASASETQEKLPEIDKASGKKADTKAEKPAKKSKKEVKVVDIKTSTPIVEEGKKVSEEKTEPKPEKVEEKAEEKAVTGTKELNVKQKEELSSNVKKLKTLKTKNEKSKIKKKRGVGFWMLISMIGIVLIGGTLVGIYFDDVKQHFPFLADKNEVKKGDKLKEMKEILTGPVQENPVQKEEVEQELPDEEASTQEEETNVEKQEDITKKEAVVENKNGLISESGINLPFHIIAGAFSSQANADRLALKIKALGYPVRVGKGNGMNLVSVKSFATKGEANAALESVKDAAPKGWVYEWK